MLAFKHKRNLFLLLFFIINITLSHAETKFVSGYNDGITTYVIVKSNGKTYQTNQYGASINKKLWNRLSDADKQKVLKYYYRHGDREVDFGSGSKAMEGFANEAQGWTQLVEKLKQKRANKSYPSLKNFYEKELKMPKMTATQCTQQIQNSTLAKETAKLREEVLGNFASGQQIYHKLIDIKWNQIGVAVKGGSALLIPVITDNFITGFVVNGASAMSQLIAGLYQFAKSTREFAKNNPNEPAELIKKLDTLCDMMEDDASTGISLITNDLEKLQSNYKELSRLCKEDYKRKQKHEQEKKDAQKELLKVPPATSTFHFVSQAKTAEEREYEICEQAENLARSISSSEYQNWISLRKSIRKLNTEYSELKPIQWADYRLSFGMGTSVKEIKKWPKNLQKNLDSVHTRLDKDKQILKDVKRAVKRFIDKEKSSQSNLNSLVAQYKKCHLGTPRRGSISIPYDASRLINDLEKKIEKLKNKIPQYIDAQEVIKKGLKNRIEKEKNGIKHYSSLEANFINSLTQIRDAVRKLDKLYLSEKIFTIDHHHPMYTEGLKKFKHKISLLPTKEKQNKAIKDLIKILKENQAEIKHQVKRLIIGQNNARYDLQLLDEFIKSYTDGAGFSKHIQDDVLDVTGVKIKDPYYDIVVDWQNGDYMLWMQGNYEWILKPETYLIDIDSIIAQLNGENNYYNSLADIYNEIKKEKSRLLSMSYSAFSPKYNSYSSQMYKIIQLARSRGEKNKKVDKMYIDAYNILNDINNNILSRERAKKFSPILKKDIKDAKEILSKKESLMYDEILSKLKDDIKPNSEAYYARKTVQLAPLFAQINALILTVEDAKMKHKTVPNENNKAAILKFYQTFKEAYESKDVSAVMAYISDDWSSSSDGTSISDLETNLENSFRVFDEIQYNISNLNIQPMGEDKFRASYNVSIIGEIYDDDITHEEKSSVQEEVGIKNGKIMILKTFGGRYWSIE